MYLAQAWVAWRVAMDRESLLILLHCKFCRAGQGAKGRVSLAPRGACRRKVWEEGGGFVLHKLLGGLAQLLDTKDFTQLKDSIST